MIAPPSTSVPERRHATLAAAYSGWLIAIAAIVVALIRLRFCATLPSETGDIARNVLYGVAVDRHGLAAAAQPLTELSSAWSSVAWARFPYNYPPLALAFFALVAAISPTVFAAKVGLTLLEAFNAVMIGRLARSRLLALLYWASPLSIWWVSREGQFEPLQAAFMLLCVFAALRARPLLAGASLALGVSSKMTAAALAPWLGRETWEQGTRARALALAGIALGLAPLAVSQLAYDGVTHLLRYSTLLVYNPYYWNPWADFFTGVPSWQIACNAIASYGLLAILAALALRSRDIAYLAPIAFVVFCKLHTNVEYWYWLLLPAFLMPIPDRRWRFALIVLCPLLDVHSLVELVHGAIGPDRFGALPSVFAPYTLP